MEFKSRKITVVIFASFNLIGIYLLLFLITSDADFGLAVAFTLFGIGLLTVITLLSYFNKVTVSNHKVRIDYRFFAHEIQFEEMQEVVLEKESGFRYFLINRNGRRIAITPFLYQRGDEIVPRIKQRLNETSH
jgi:hypothetical protein